MKTKIAYVQYFAGLVVSLHGVVYGLSVGWSSPTVLLLSSNESPLSTGKMTMEEASWVTSFKSLGWMISSMVFGFVANRFGRKWPSPFTQIGNVYYLYVARFTQGVISVGAMSISQFYFVEISNDDVRDAIGSSMIVGTHIGVVVAFALGGYLSYEAIPICAVTLLVIFSVVFIIFPETPLFLIKQNKVSEAERSIRFYRNISKKDAEIECEFIQLEIEKLKNLVGSTKPNKISIKWSDLFRNPGRKAMVIGLFLAALCHFSGSFILISYTASIFEEVGSFMSSNESALVVAVIQFIGTILVPFLVDRTGRKTLYIVSCIGSIFGYFVLAFYMMFESWEYPVQGITWIPIVSFSFVVLAQSLGISTLSFAVTAEVLPENIREFGVTFCNAVLALCAFVFLKCMPDITNALGFYGAMFLFGGLCIPSTLFIKYYIPETKGKSYEEIMQMLK